ncbi:MAG: pentapeptide repeat-containing protein [Planctomycetota bacterium]|nr:pentapeptide repeat-containing protein [Planctomycetota bacterium]
MQGARASLDDLAVRWETPRGREIKDKVIVDVTNNKGRGLERILKEFIYTDEVLNKADLRCITMEDTELADAVIENADLSWSSFKNSNLLRASFTNCNLKRASFEKADISLSRFKKCDLSRVDFTDGKLEHTNFQEAKLTGSRFINAYAPRASFQAARMAKSNFLGAFLEQCNFSGADCSNTNFSSGALDVFAAKPDKMGGIRFNDDLADFEDDVGVKALTFRSTRKFKGLDVLLRMTATLEKLKLQKENPSATPQNQTPPPAAQQAQAPYPPQGGEANTDDPFQFGAPLRTRGFDRGQVAHSPNPSSGYPQGSPAEAPQFGANLRNATRRFEPKGDPRSYQTPSRVLKRPRDLQNPNPPGSGEYPLRGKPGSGEYPLRANQSGEIPRPNASGEYQNPNSSGEYQNPNASGEISKHNVQPPSAEDYQDYGYGAPEQDPNQSSSHWKQRPPQTPQAPQTPNHGTPRPSHRRPTNAAPRPGLRPGPGGPRPGPGPTGSHTMRRRRPTGAGRPLQAPPPGRPPAGPPTVRRPGPQTRRLPPRNTQAMPPIQGAPPQTYDGLLAPADPNTPGPTGDWDEAIGILLQNKHNITKIVIELGDNSQFIYRQHGS